MFGRIVLTALAGGAIAGVFVWGAHMVKTTPLILHAEVYEDAAPAHARGAASAAATEDESWAPADGMERGAYTFLTDMLSSIGFAFMLTGAMALAGRAVDWQRGIVWGLCGFAAFYLSPAFGLPPELPGMGGADLHHRQLWWLATAMSAAGGLALIFLAGPRAAKIAGGVLILIPHVVGAPGHEIASGPLPAELASQFAVATLVITGLFWTLLGASTGYFYRRLEPS